MTASFRSIRAFVHDVLLRLPFAALEKLSFRRETVGATEVGAEIHLVLFLDAAATADKFASTGKIPRER